MNNLFGNSVEIVGNSSKNLVLQTSGKVKIQFGKKFIDLIDSNGNLNTGLNSIIKKVDSEDKIVSDGFYYYNEMIIACISGNKLKLASTSGDIYVSFLEEQSPTGEQKYNALKNIGFIYKSLSDVENYPTNGIIYVEQEKSLYVINNGNISKYQGNIPNPINTQVVITKNDNLEGSLVISGTGINNSIKLDNLKIYNNESDVIFSSGGTQIFSIDSREVAEISPEGLSVRGINSLNSNIDKGFNIYQNNDNEYVLNIDIINVRKNISFKDSILYSAEFGLDTTNKIEEDDEKYLKYPHYSDELYDELTEDIKNASTQDNYKYILLPYGVIKDLIQTYVKEFTNSSISLNGKYWYVDNYLVDIAIDEYVTKYYNLSVKAKSDSEVIEGDWESYDKNKRTLIMQAALIPCAEDGTFYSTKYFIFDKIYDCKYTLAREYQEEVNFKSYAFKEIPYSEYDESNKNHYKIEGAFADLGLMIVDNGGSPKDIREITTNDLATSDNYYNAKFQIDGDTLKLYNISTDEYGSYFSEDTYDTYIINNFAGTTTVPKFHKDPNLTFLKQIQAIGDSAGRGPAYRVNRGRTRPLNSNSSSGTGRYSIKDHSVSEASGHRLNSIFNRTLVQRYAEDEKMFLSMITVDEINADGPASYPSGHASQTWAVAMLLAQVYCKDLPQVKKYMRGAYKVGLERSLARFHWNSDIMYGRLFATMIMPIINANPLFDDAYDALTNELIGTTQSLYYPSTSLFSEGFNLLMNNFDMVDVSASRYYLSEMYNRAMEIFNDYKDNGKDSDYAFLFTNEVDDPVYYEIFPTNGYSLKYSGESHNIKFRGENTTYNVSDLTREDIYISWFIGLCLSELNVTSGNDNNQTKIMAKAYALGGGRELDLYNEYKIDYDPMILRYAAGAVYMILRGTFSRDSLRNGGIGNSANFAVDDDWAGFNGSNFDDSYELGYCVDTYVIFPNPPGPYNELYGSKITDLKTQRPYESKSVGSDYELTGTQRKSQFITSSQVQTSGNSSGSGSGSGSGSSSTHTGGYEGKIYIKIRNELSQDFITNGEFNFEFVSPDPYDSNIHYSSANYESTNRLDKHGRFSNDIVTISGGSTVPESSYYTAIIGPLFEAGEQYEGSNVVQWNGKRYLAGSNTTPASRHGSTGAVLYDSTGVSYEITVESENESDERYIIDGHKYTFVINSLVTP